MLRLFFSDIFKISRNLGSVDRCFWIFYNSNGSQKSSTIMSVNSDNCAKMLKKKKVIDELVRLAIIFSSETEKCEHHYIIRSALSVQVLSGFWFLGYVTEYSSTETGLMVVTSYTKSSYSTKLDLRLIAFVEYFILYK